MALPWVASRIHALGRRPGNIATRLTVVTAAPRTALSTRARALSLTTLMIEAVTSQHHCSLLAMSGRRGVARGSEIHRNMAYLKTTVKRLVHR